MCHNTDHFLSKLRQIDALAQQALNDAPPGLAKDRIRLIAGLAKYLATEIELRARRRG
jgi:hypothetical protein